MQRGRNSGRDSPGPTIAKDYPRIPSPLYSRSPSRTRPNRRASASRSPSRGPRSRRGSRSDSFSSDYSSDRSPARGNKQNKSKRSQLKEQFKDKTDTTSGLKTSLVFLGSVAAATYAAHKYWPKGVTYGEKEEWEIEKAEKKAEKKARRAAEGFDDNGRFDGPPRQRNDRLAAVDQRRDRDSDRPRSSQGRLGIEGKPRRHDGPAEYDEIVYVRRPASVNRAPADGLTTMSLASGSRTGDVRRAQYVEDSLGARPDRRSYIPPPRDRQDDDHRAAPRYVETEIRSGRYSVDGGPDPRRGERVMYARPEDNYR